MTEEEDPRTIIYLGQEAILAIQNAGLVAALETMSKEAMDMLMDTDPFDTPKIAVAQLRVKTVAEVMDRLEFMAQRGAAVKQEVDAAVVPRDLN